MTVFLECECLIKPTFQFSRIFSFRSQEPKLLMGSNKDTSKSTKRFHQSTLFSDNICRLQSIILIPYTPLGNSYRHQNTIYNSHQSSGSSNLFTSHIRCLHFCMGLVLSTSGWTSNLWHLDCSYKKTVKFTNISAELTRLHWHRIRQSDTILLFFHVMIFHYIPMGLRIKPS